MSVRTYRWSLLAFASVLLGLAAAVPPFDDELYYWCWSRDLQLSYYDHPPMVAYMIRVSTELFGNSIFAIRLPGVVSGLVVVGVIGWLSRPRSLLPMIMLSPVLTFAAILITPDTPLLMFWALYLAWLVAIHERLAIGRVPGWWWLVGGIVLGCGVLGKYTMALCAMSGGVSFLFAGNWRRWLPGYVAHALVAVAVASPILIYNIPNNFAPLRYQWAHSMGSPRPGLIPFAEFVGVQWLLFGGVPFVILVWGYRHWQELAAQPRMRVCACLFLLPLTFFLFKATRGRLEGNWAFPVFIACWPLAEQWYSRVRQSRVWRRVALAGFAVPLGFSLALTWHLVSPLPILPPSQDRAYRQWARMDAARAVAEDMRAAGYSGPVFVPTYQWVALLRWHGVDARQVDGASRPSQFTNPPESLAGLAHAVVCAEGMLPEKLVEGYATPRVLHGYPVIVRGLRYQDLWWFDYPAARPAPKQKGIRASLDPTGTAPSR